MNQEQITFGTCQCGASGQLFKTGKCSNCYIADLEALVETAKQSCDKIIEATGAVVKGGRTYDCQRQQCEWPMCECKAKS